MKKIILMLLLCGLLLSMWLAAFPRALIASSDSLSSVQDSVSASTVDWWPMFHHDPSHSGYSTSEAPDTNETSWNYRTPSLWESGVSSSPAVADGKVYVGSRGAWVYCFDAATGALIWSYTTGASAVYSSPAVADGKVYVGAGYKVYCLDALTGAFIWDYTTGSVIYNSSPAVADGKIYISSYDNTLYCLNGATGAYIWSYPTSNPESSPAVAGGKVYVGSGDKIYCLDAATGAFLWDYTTGYYFSSPAVADGKVYAVSYPKVYCFDAATGALIWSYTTGASASQFSSPAVAYGKVYVGLAGGKVYCLDAATGVLNWSYTTGTVYSSPAVADGKVYVGVGYKVYCLDAFTGAFIWSYTTGDYVISSPAVAEGRVYVGSLDRFVYAFGPDWWLTLGHDAGRSKFSTSKGPITNETLWTYRVGTLPPSEHYEEKIETSPSIAYGKVYFGADDNKTYCLDAATGALVWSFDPRDIFPWHNEASFRGSPTIAGGKVYITATGSIPGYDSWSYFYRLDAATGDCDWTFEFPAATTVVDDSPIVVDGLVFITTTSNVRCYNITTRLGWVICNTGWRTSGVAVFDGRVYVGSIWVGGAHISCYNYLGNQLWDYVITGDIMNMYGPVVVNSRVYAGAYIQNAPDRGMLYCLNAYNGLELWPPKHVGLNVASSPAVAYGKVYLAIANGLGDYLYCYDAFTGDEIWTSSPPWGGNYPQVYGSPAVAEGKVYIRCWEPYYSTGYHYFSFYCYNATTGAQIWRYKFPIYYWYAMGYINVPDPAVADGKVYVSFERNMTAFGTNPQIHLESIQDTEASSNLGTITFDDTPYTLPSDISKATGNYQTQYSPASSSYIFDHWETAGELHVSNPYTNPTAVTVSGDGTLRAVYKAHVHTITASAGSGGTINPSGSVPVNHGDDITFTITPNAGYHIDVVFVDTVNVGAVPSYTFTNVVSDHSITAYFHLNQYTITASAEGGGTISPSGLVVVYYEQQQTFTMTADPGYEILDVVVDGTDHRGPILSYTFYSVTADHSISAFFGINNHDIAVIDVTPTRNIVGKGYPLLIDVTVENQGARAESFNVTVYYGNSAITAEQWETFWSKGDVNRDGYINTVDMNLLGDAYGTTPGDPYWNPWADLNQDLQVDIMDLAICNFNYGYEIWTYFTTGGVIGTQTVINLAAGNTQTLTFTWDTSDIPYGNYVVGSHAVPILGDGPPLGKEVDRADNTFTGGTVLVTIPGDVNGDRIVNVFDILKIKNCRSGPPPGPGGYDLNVDINNDGFINVFDILIAKAHLGQSW